MDGAAAFTVRLAVAVFAEVAVMVTGVEFETLVVVTVKVVLVWPTGTDTLAGTVAAALLEASVTMTPAEPAGAESVTVPVGELPPVTVEGLTVMLPIVA